MSEFIMSPGTVIREINNSQYSSTTDTAGNVVVLVGYAEKGDFEPTYCYGEDDFVQKFGKTLAEVPYLSQAAYKYFDDGKVLLVCRAGDNRDPDIYPNAAKHSSKTIRLNPSAVAAKSGYQTFRNTGTLLAGTFAANTEYSFNVLADNRAFNTPKYMETWGGILDETYNGMGMPIPSGTVLDNVVKFACENATSTTFEVNHKRDLSHGSTQEYYGTGRRNGMALGSTVEATIYKYFENGVYSEQPTDFVSIRGIYGAAVSGSINVISGFDWSNTAQNFVVRLGTRNYRIDLTEATTSIDEVIEALNTAFVHATDTSSNNEVDISGYIGAMKLCPTATDAYAALIHKAGEDQGFELIQGTADALTTLGIAPSIYNDGDSIYGRWDGVAPVANVSQNFSGNFIFRKQSITNNAISFQDVIGVTITSPAQGGWSLSEIATQIQNRLNAAYPAYNFPQGRGIAAVDISTGKLKITAAGEVGTAASIVRITAGTPNDLVSLLGGVDNAVAGSAATSVGEVKVTLKAAQKGSYGQKLALKTETQIVKSGGSTVTYYNVYVYYDGKVVSSYYKVNWTDATASNFVLTKMTGDAYLSFSIDDEDDNDAFAQLPDGYWTLGDDTLPSGVTAEDAEIVSYSVGTNGWVEANGAITSMTADFIQALDKVSNPEVYEFNIIAAPGDASVSMQNAIQDFCEARRDCIGVIDAAPFGIGLGIANKTRSITEVNDACSTLNSSYVAAYWPWVLDYDSDNDQYVYLPPSIYGLKAMVYTDTVADPWNAPAGLTRGKVSAQDVEYSAREVERDILYGNTAIVNPIVKFVGEGITIWGQKTAERTLTATNRINVRRLMIYAERLIAKMARTFLFEQNDESNWSAFARQANGILEPIRQRRGLYSFEVICDSSTNTAPLVNNNLMAGKIYLQPTKTIEGIYVDFTITSYGAVVINER